MGRLFLLSLVVFSSLIAYSFAKRQSGMEDRSLRLAIATFLECLGTFSVFFVVNVGLGAVLILLVRGFTSQFVSIYTINDATLIVLSVAQGFIFQLWWRQQ